MSRDIRKVLEKERIGDINSFINSYEERLVSCINYGFRVSDDSDLRNDMDYSKETWFSMPGEIDDNENYSRGLKRR